MTDSPHPAFPFIDHVLPAEGPYAALVLSDKMRQQSCDTKNKVLDVVYTGAGGRHDTFFGLASYKEDKRKGFRAKDNVRALRCVWHDVDVGKPGAYDKQTDALAAVYTLVSRDKLLSPTYVVNSGSGLHLYWCFTTDITVAQWDRAANQTRTSLLQDPLLCVDTTRVTDAASILRMPGTFNCKDAANPTPVTVVQEGQLYTTQEFDAAYGDPAPTQAKAPVAKPVALGPPIAYSVPALGTVKRIEAPSSKPTAKQLIGACAQFEHYATKQDEQTEPLWRALLGLCRYTAEGEALAHAISKNYKGYTHAATQAKYDGWNGNWPMCSGIEGASGHASLCDGCLLQGKGKSPIHGAMQAVRAIEDSEPGAPPPTQREISTAPVTIDGYVLPPSPYVLRDAETWARLAAEKKDEAGNVITTWEDKKVLNARIVITKLGLGEGGALYVHMKVSMSDKSKIVTHDLVAPSSALLETRSCSGVFAGIGLSPGASPTSSVALRTFMGKYIDHVRVHAGVDKEYTRFGWSEDSTKFVVGATVYNQNGPPTEALLSTGLASHLTQKKMEPHGTLKGWQQCVQPLMNNSQCPHFTLAVLAGFASTLMYMTPEKNGIMFLHSAATGTGKTLAASMANSVFSVFGTGEKTAGSTEKSVALICEKYHSMVSIYDECTNMYADQASRMIYTLSSQQGGSALTKDRTIREAGSWSTIHILTANISLEGLLTKDMSKSGRLVRSAEILRGWDISVPRSEQFYSILDDINDHSFDENHGVAGPLFIQYVLDNMDAVKAMLKGARSEVAKTSTKDTRFTNNLASCLHVAGEVVNKLGILEIDMSWLTRATEKRQEQAKAKLEEHDPTESATSLFARIMADRVIRENINIVYAPSNGGKLVRVQKGTGGYNEDRPCDVRVTIGPDINQVKVYIRGTALKDACGRLGLGESTVLASLKKVGLHMSGGRPVRRVVSLNAGGNDTMSKLRARCLTIELNAHGGLEYNDIIEDMKSKTETVEHGKVVPLGARRS